MQTKCQKPVNNTKGNDDLITLAKKFNDLKHGEDNDDEENNVNRTQLRLETQKPKRQSRKHNRKEKDGGSRKREQFWTRK